LVFFCFCFCFCFCIFFATGRHIGLGIDLRTTKKERRKTLWKHPENCLFCELLVLPNYRFRCGPKASHLHPPHSLLPPPFLPSSSPTWRSPDWRIQTC
jgi:hypothetical protein